MLIACGDIGCFGVAVLWCVGWRLERLDHRQAEEWGALSDMGWQVHEKLITLTSLARGEGAMGGSTRTCAPEASIGIHVNHAVFRDMTPNALMGCEWC